MEPLNKNVQGRKSRRVKGRNLNRCLKLAHNISIFKLKLLLPTCPIFGVSWLMMMMVVVMTMMVTTPVSSPPSSSVFITNVWPVCFQIIFAVTFASPSSYNFLFSPSLYLLDDCHCPLTAFFGSLQSVPPFHPSDYCQSNLFIYK